MSSTQTKADGMVENNFYLLNMYVIHNNILYFYCTVVTVSQGSRDSPLKEIGETIIA